MPHGKQLIAIQSRINTSMLKLSWRPWIKYEVTDNTTHERWWNLTEMLQFRGKFIPLMESPGST